jgi:ribose transport system permease protein
MLKKFGREIGITVLLIILVIVAESLNHRFLSVVNLSNLARLVGMYGIFGIGAALVIITGGIDLSSGSMFAILGVLLSIALMEKHWPWPWAVIAVLGVAAFLGTIHGFLITRMRLQPFIVTLCGLMIYRGLAQFIAKDETKGFGDATGFEKLKDLVTGEFHGVPVQFIMLLVIAAVFGVVLHYSVYGRYLYAVGRNEEASRYSGIETRRVISSAYIIAAVLSGISAILFAFYTNSISPSTHGQGYELYGIAAAVLGGCSLRGGEGSIVGVILGATLLQVLQNLVNLLGIPSSLNFAVVGAVILIGILADQLFSRRGKRPRKVAASASA